MNAALDAKTGSRLLFFEPETSRQRVSGALVSTIESVLLMINTSRFFFRLERTNERMLLANNSLAFSCHWFDWLSPMNMSCNRSYCRDSLNQRSASRGMLASRKNLEMWHALTYFLRFVDRKTTSGRLRLCNSSCNMWEAQRMISNRPCGSLFLPVRLVNESMNSWKKTRVVHRFSIHQLLIVSSDHGSHLFFFISLVLIEIVLLRC